MADYVTSTGLDLPSVEELLVAIQTQIRADVDSQFDVDPDSLGGNLVGVFASHLREAFEALEQLAASFDPDAAEGTFLDSLCAITGTKRRQPTTGKLTGNRRAIVNLTIGTTLPAGSVAHVDGQPTNRWVTTETVGPVVATGNYLVTMESETVGEFKAPTGTLTAIATPIPGWNTITNPADAVPGLPLETDEELRLRRIEELDSIGSGTKETIEARLAEAKEPDGSDQIQSVKVYENQTDVVDVLGLPPHSFECVIWDGDPGTAGADTIAQVIWDNKPAGIRAVGSVTGNAKTVDGATEVVAFTRVTRLFFTVEATIQVDETFVGISAADDILVAIPRKPAQDVYYDDYLCALKNTQGVVRVQTIEINGVPFGNLACGAREILITIPGFVILTVVP